MTGKPTDSKWRVTPRAARKRRILEASVADEEREIAERLAERHDVPVSRIVGAGLRALGQMSKSAAQEYVSAAEAAIAKK